MPVEPLLVEVIGGPKVVVEIDPSQTIAAIAVIAAGAVDRSLTDEDGSEKAWRLFAPNGKGGFAPAKPEAKLGRVAASMRKLKASGEEGGFAGPGTHDGRDYLFRLRLFVPSLPPPKPVEEVPPPIEDEEAIDLTNLDADADGLETVRHVEIKEERRTRRRPPGQRSGPRTGRHKAIDGKRKPEATADGTRRRKRRTGDLPEEASGSGSMRRRKRASGELPKSRRRKRPHADSADPAESSDSLPATGDAAETAAKPVSAEAAAAPPAVADDPATTSEPTEGPSAPEIESTSDGSSATAPAHPAPPEPTPEADPEPPPPDPTPAPPPEARPTAASSAPGTLSPEQQVEPTTVMAREAVAVLAKATAAADALAARPAEPSVAEPSDPPPEPPPVPIGVPEDVKVSKTRVVARALTGPGPERGTRAHTGSLRTGTSGGRKTGTMKGGRSTGTMKGGRSTGTMRGTRSGSKAPDGARRTASGGRTGKKKRGSGGIIWLLVALLLFAAVTVAFVVALSDRGVDGPEGDTPAERGPTRLSDRLDIEEWPSSDPTVAASVVRFNGLGATSVADLADAERMGRMSGLATELDTACGGGSFEGCEALARVVFASYLGCRQASACSGDEARSLFRRSIEASDSAIVLLRQLDGGSQGLALKRMTVHAVRLAGQGMPLLRADSPQLASLAEQACAGALGTTPDCTDALKK